MSEVSYVVVGIALAVLGVLFVRERRYWQVLIGGACLAAGLYLAIDGIVTLNAMLH
ncbi:MAG: hypothetical protein OXI12_09815 [Gammaproteobacteria bacterium]|nr:hypothetical protein [Gammaproteobacteria bacterium]